MKTRTAFPGASSCAKTGRLKSACKAMRFRLIDREQNPPFPGSVETAAAPVR